MLYIYIYYCITIIVSSVRQADRHHPTAPRGGGPYYNVDNDNDNDNNDSNITI